MAEMDAGNRIILTPIGQDYRVESENGRLYGTLYLGGAITVQATTGLELEPINWRARFLLWLSERFAPMPARVPVTFVIEIRPRLEDWQGRPE